MIPRENALQILNDPEQRPVVYYDTVKDGYWWVDGGFHSVEDSIKIVQACTSLAIPASDMITTSMLHEIVRRLENLEADE